MHGPETGSTWSGRGRPPAWIAKSDNWDLFLIN
ncbi:H-NS family nucleoid-associated regulatory protein [Burkholderia glumae]